MNVQSKPREIRNHYPIRVIGYLLVFIEHILIYYNDSSFTTLMWFLLGSYTILYPHLIYVLTKTVAQERINFTFECALISLYIVLWGFNETLVLSLVSIIFLTTMSAGGWGAALYAVTMMGVFTGLFTWVIGFHYRQDLNIYAKSFAIVGTLIYYGCIGFVFHQVNRSLFKAKNNLSKQTEDLIGMNEIARQVNSVLDIDALMKTIMAVVCRNYVVESIFITAFDDEREHVELIGTLSDHLNEEEHYQLRQLKFSLQSDNQSFFLKQLIKDEVLYLPELSMETFMSSATVDKLLYETKPAKSLIYFPVTFKGKVIAGIAFINYTQPLGLTKHDIERIQQLLLQVGTAIKNIRLFDRANNAKQKAEESEQAKSRFLANMSHEIRTPMTAILGYSEALQDDHVEKEERKQFTQIIINSGKHLLSIINDILDISKIEADKIEVEMMDVNLPMLIHELNANIQLKAHEKDLLCRLELEFPLPFDIRIDPTRLKQVLFNLGSNAVKFTQEGEVVIKVSWQSPDTLIIAVQDSGIGLNEDEVARLFKPFSQADSSTTRLYGGTGLGLYISKNLIQIMGGDLTVQSEKGKGSIFTVNIEILQDSTDSWIRTQQEFDRYIAQENAQQISDDVPVLSGTVLVADDTLENQSLIRHLMEKSGLSVDIVNNGQEAVDQFDRKKYDLVFLDIQMPVMGGQEAAQLIHDRNSHVPLIAFTANVMKHQVASYHSQSFVDVVEKPLAREKLYSVLQKYLSKEGDLISILVVDDNKVNRMVLSRYISKLMNHVMIDHAEDGVQAINKVASCEYQLIFMDVEMPIMNGVDATLKIREEGFTAPIYMVTGHTESEQLNHAISAGASGYLQKPIDKDQLASVLKPIIRSTLDSGDTEPSQALS